MRTCFVCALALVCGAASGRDANGSASPPLGADADTRAWWTTTAVIADAGMEGRDTGSAGYARAASYVVEQFKAAGLEPAGDQGGWLQAVPLTQVRVESEGTSRRATNALPSEVDAPLALRGYCSSPELGTDMKGKIAVCFGTRRRGLPSAAERIRADPKPSILRTAGRV